MKNQETVEKFIELRSGGINPMLPIIRRRRQPMLPSDPPETVSVVQRYAGLPPASSSSSPAPSSASLVEQSDRPKSENRTDFGQKRTDSVPAPRDLGFVVPKRLENRSDFGQKRTDSIPSTPTGPQPSTFYNPGWFRPEFIY
jgi:hypothetical protein